MGQNICGSKIGGNFMTEFMLAHPYLFTIQVAMISLGIAALGNIGRKGNDFHYHVRGDLHVDEDGKGKNVNGSEN